MMLKISGLSFTPIHNFIPKKSVQNSPFILSHHNNRKIPVAQQWYKYGAVANGNEATSLLPHRRVIGDNVDPKRGKTLSYDVITNKASGISQTQK